MNYKETIDFLFHSLPMYQRVGDAAIRKDLTNIRLLCNVLDEPQLSFQSIHVAGTNGKGSTSHMLASVFQAAGKKVGLYTSPHYVDFRERIRINGRMISESQVVSFVAKYKDAWARIQPSFFEITVAMAFYHFRKNNVDIAIIETGLGGRLDSTNIITPLMSVITNIGYDHMQLLGHTLREIAGEKAGIIKRNIPVIIGEWQKDTSEVFKKQAALLSADIHFASRLMIIDKLKQGKGLQQYSFRTRSADWQGKIYCDLTGPYQVKNIRTVLASCYIWNKNFHDAYLEDNAIRKGLSNVKKSTSMMGRWMTIRKDPLVITDAAHNIDGFRSIVRELMKMKATRKHFVLGFVSDKEVLKVLSLFPERGLYYWCSPDIPRGKPVVETMEAGEANGLKGEAFSNVAQAYHAALSRAKKSDLVFIGGSSYVVGDFLAGLKT